MSNAETHEDNARRSDANDDEAALKTERPSMGHENIAHHESGLVCDRGPHDAYTQAGGLIACEAQAGWIRVGWTTTNGALYRKGGPGGVFAASPDGSYRPCWTPGQYSRVKPADGRSGAGPFEAVPDQVVLAQQGPITTSPDGELAAGQVDA